MYGVPETFVIDREGAIAHKHVGPIAEKDWEETIGPLLRRLRAGTGREPAPPKASGNPSRSGGDT